MVVLYILLAILAFGVLILVHECGHFFAARAMGVTVREFSIGMGPMLLSYTSKKTGTVYKICMLPIGGYVSMLGEEEESDDPSALCRKKPWQRLIIMAAGGIVNILVGALLTFLLVASMPSIRASCEVGPFAASDVTGFTYSSADSGLREGDIILTVDGKRVHVGAEMDYEIMRRGIRPITLTVLRDGKEITLPNVVFPTYEESGQLLGGRDFYLRADKEPLPILRHTFYRSVMTVRMVWESLFDLITGRFGVDAVSGPVGVASAMTTAAESGFSNFVYLVAVISLNLGVVNLFPLPALDGGHIVFVLFEMISKRKVPERIENAIHSVGLMLLLGLMLLVTGKDIVTLFK